MKMDGEEIIATCLFVNCDWTLQLIDAHLQEEYIDIYIFFPFIQNNLLNG